MVSLLLKKTLIVMVRVLWIRTVQVYVVDQRSLMNVEYVMVMGLLMVPVTVMGMLI